MAALRSGWRRWVTRKTIVVAAIVIGAAALSWALIHEEPPACAEEISITSAKLHLLPELDSMGYSLADAGTFRIMMLVKDEYVDWPTYFIYFTGMKNGHVQGITAVGNGCGIYDVQEETAPMTITKVD